MKYIRFSVEYEEESYIQRAPESSIRLKDSDKHTRAFRFCAQGMPSQPCTPPAHWQWTGREQVRATHPLLGRLHRGRQAQQAGHQGSQGTPLPSLLQGHAAPKNADHVWEAQLVHPVPLPIRQPCAQEQLS